jgi:hypothetical protein
VVTESLPASTSVRPTAAGFVAGEQKAVEQVVDVDEVEWRLVPEPIKKNAPRSMPLKSLSRRPSHRPVCLGDADDNDREPVLKGKDKRSRLRAS